MPKRAELRGSKNRSKLRVWDILGGFWYAQLWVLQVIQEVVIVLMPFTIRIRYVFPTLPGLEVPRGSRALTCRSTFLIETSATLYQDLAININPSVVLPVSAEPGD